MHEYNKMPRKMGGAPTDTMGKGGPRTPHPTGGEQKPVNPPGAKMPRKSKDAPITHTPLHVFMSDDVHDGQTDSSSKMPKRMGGAAQMDPRRR